MKRHLTIVPDRHPAIMFLLYLICCFAVKSVHAETPEPNPAKKFCSLQEMTGKKLLDLNVYSEGSGDSTVSLLSLLTGSSCAIIAVIDPVLIDGHVQRYTFERFCRHNNREDVTFLILYLARNPKDMLKQMLQVRPSPCSICTMSRQEFESQMLSIDDRAIIIFSDKEFRMIKCLPSYCSYDALQTGLHQFNRDSDESGGPHQ